jgi:hypothetical protein
MRPDSYDSCKQPSPNKQDPQAGSGDFRDSLDDEVDGALDSVNDETAFAEDMIRQQCELDSQQRLWLKAVIPLLQIQSQETEQSGRTQFAFDMMYIAACDRVARILRSDMRQEMD